MIHFKSSYDAFKLFVKSGSTKLNKTLQIRIKLQNQSILFKLSVFIQSLHSDLLQCLESEDVYSMHKLINIECVRPIEFIEM